MIVHVDTTVILLEIALVTLFLLWFLIIRLMGRCIYEYGSVSEWWASLMENKMYFPCCRPKSVSHENLHDEHVIGGGGGGPGGTPSRRRPNPIIVGLANHLREHHSSARNSAVAGCFGFSDSPPRYEDIYVEAGGPESNTSTTSNNSRNNAPRRHPQHHFQGPRHYHPEGICNEDGTKEMMAEEGISMEVEEETEVPPPSYEESVGMTSETSCVVVTITIEQ